MKNALKLIILLSLTLMACDKKEMSAPDYVNWVENEDNGLRVSKSVDDYTFTLQYKPLDYMFLYECKKRSLNEKEFSKRKKESEGMHYLTLRIKSEKNREIMSDDLVKEEDYYNKLEYFSSYMQGDISLVQGSDTLPCNLFHFERNYGLSPNNDFVLGFDKLPKKNNTEDLTLIYEDRVLGTGKIQMTISGSKIEQTPVLRFN